MSPRKTVSPENRKGYSNKKISWFSKNVQARRLELGITQDQLAKMIGVARPKISQIEGGISPTDTDRIWQIADALQTTCDELLRPKDK